MSHCTKCGKKNLDTAKFCTSCGTVLAEQGNKTSNKKSSKAIIFSLLVIFTIGGFYFLFLNKRKKTTSQAMSSVTDTISTNQNLAKPEDNNAWSTNHSLVFDTYTGKSGHKDFILKIEAVSGNKVRGYNITGGFKRLVEGEFLVSNGKWDQFGDGTVIVTTYIYNLTLREPRDHEWDGVFQLRIELSDWFNKGAGTWKGYKLDLERQITFSAPEIESD